MCLQDPGGRSVWEVRFFLKELRQSATKEGEFVNADQDQCIHPIHFVKIFISIKLIDTRWVPHTENFLYRTLPTRSDNFCNKNWIVIAWITRSCWYEHNAVCLFGKIRCVYAEVFVHSMLVDGFYQYYRYWSYSDQKFDTNGYVLKWIIMVYFKCLKWSWPIPAYHISENLYLSI